MGPFRLTQAERFDRLPPANFSLVLSLLLRFGGYRAQILQPPD